MSVSGIVVVIIIVEMMQGLPATIMIFKVKVFSSNFHHRGQICEPLKGKFCIFHVYVPSALMLCQLKQLISHCVLY